jgi:hypothetical protein
VLCLVEYFISFQKKDPQSLGVLRLLEHFMLPFNPEEISPILRSAGLLEHFISIQKKYPQSLGVLHLLKHFEAITSAFF